MYTSDATKELISRRQHLQLGHDKEGLLPRNEVTEDIFPLGAMEHCHIHTYGSHNNSCEIIGYA